MNNVLPIIHQIVAGGWNPDLLLSQRDQDKWFAKMETQLRRYSFSNYDEIDSAYADLLSSCVEYEPTKDTQQISFVVMDFMSSFVSPYRKTKSASDYPRLVLAAAVGRNYADRFYDIAVYVDMRHCLLWLIREESRLKSDDDMKQVVREVLTVITNYCRLTLAASDTSKAIFEKVLKKLTCLYFEIVNTFVKEHADWGEYLEKYYGDQLPLSFWEFTSAYWNELPSEEDEKAWEEFEQASVVVTSVVKQPEKLAPTAEEAIENEIIVKYNHFVDVVKTYKFFECPAVACLTQEQRGKLIRSIVNRSDNYGAYAVAMLCHLEYDKWMMENFAKDNPHSRAMTKGTIHKHWLDALSLTSERAIAGNYNVIRKADSNEDKNIYKSHEYTLKVQEDYENIKNS